MFSIPLVDAYLVVILFVLFQLDLYLTGVGRSMNNKYYEKFFMRETYELNPLWRKSVDKGKKFIFRRFLLSILVTILIILYFELNVPIAEILLGGGFFLYVVINLRHIQNIWTFYYLKNHSDELEGAIKINLAYSIQVNFVSGVYTFLLVFIITLINPSLFLIGGTCMLFIYLIFVKILQWRVRKKIVSLKQAVTY